jgi:hypothetical protein
MKKNRCRIIIVLLILSVITNAYLFYSLSNTNRSSACDNDHRFDNEKGVGATGIKPDEAKDLVLKYRTDFPPSSNDNRPTGFVLTKKVFDEIFADPSFNSVTLDMVKAREEFSLIVKGYVSENTIVDGDPTGVYLVRSFCPTDCSAW